MKKISLLIMLSLFALTLSACSTGIPAVDTWITNVTGGKVDVSPVAETPENGAPVAETPAPADEANTSDEGSVETVVVEDGTCEGLHDYQLPDLTELSSDDGLLIHVQFGRDGKEYETLLPTGRYTILKPFEFGHVWELGQSCSAAQALEKHVGPSIQRRIERKVNSGGYVHWTTLIDDGTLEIVWQQKPVQDIPETLVSSVKSNETAEVSSDESDSNVGFIGRDGDADGRTIGDDTYAYVVECWKPVSGICVIPVGESISGLMGANWKFGSTEAALADANSKGKTVFVVEDGKLVNPTN